MSSGARVFPSLSILSVKWEPIVSSRERIPKVHPAASGDAVKDSGDIVLVSCYELGHQPLAVASPLAFLRKSGFSPIGLDLSVGPLDDDAAASLARARMVAISVPMHTALRLGVEVAQRAPTLPRAT